MTALCRDFLGRVAGGLRSQDVGHADAADGTHRQAADLQETAARQVRRNTLPSSPGSLA